MPIMCALCLIPITVLSQLCKHNTVGWENIEYNHKINLHVWVELFYLSST